jgi:hypothetical protein
MGTVGHDVQVILSWNHLATAYDGFLGFKFP